MTPADLLLIPLLAVAAPLIVRTLGRWVHVPIVVFELVLGILVGPAVLGWVHPSAMAGTLAQFGLAMLFFVAGTEMQFEVFRGRTGRRSVLGWLISLVAGVAVGWLIAPGQAAVIVGIALCSTALGVLLPILRDAAELSTPFGTSIAAVGAVGEFGPLLAISIFLGGRSLGVSSLVLGAFAVVALLSIVLAFQVPRGALHRAVNTTLHTSGQFAIRVVFLILGALVALSVVLDLDMLLGAFTAGIVWQLLMRDASEPDSAQVESKIEAVAFGFLVPIFFIYTGVTFDLAALVAQPALLALLPIALVVLLIVRGLPSLLAAPEAATRRDRAAIVLLGATGLPIIVAVTAIGVHQGLLRSGVAAALVGAGMLSVLLFPAIAMGLRGERVPAPVARRK